MPLFQRRDTHPALVLGPGTRGAVVSFEELRRVVEERKGGSPKLIALEAEPTLDFIATVCARLEEGKPFAIANAKWTAHEKRDRLAILQSATHPATCLVLFTSGSSGNPKAVQISKEAIEANTKAVISTLDFDKVAHQVLHLPLHYAYSLLGQLLPALRAGVTTRLLESFNDVLPLLRGVKIDGMWSGVPSHYEALLRVLPSDVDVTGVTHVVSAGAPFSKALREKLAAKFSHAVIYNNYGMTECGPRILSLASRHPRFFSDATGYSVGNLKARIDADGQLLVTGPQVMLGYLGDPTGTSERIEDGWLKTGDLADISKDGLVTIKGRLDDLVKIGGERLSLGEVEAALKSIEGIDEAAVLVKEHEIMGSQLVAFVVAKVNEQEKWIQELGTKLAAAKIPRDYRPLEALPKLDSGKIDRARLKAILADT